MLSISIIRDSSLRTNWWAIADNGVAASERNKHGNFRVCGKPRVIFCRKTGHYEWTCRGPRAVGRGRVGLIHKDGTEGELTQNDPEENVSN